MTLPISPRALAEIEGYEISSRANYEAHLMAPYWPGGLSGATWGIGYDGGYETADQIDADWGLTLPAEIVARLAACAHITGPAASLLIPHLADIRIPYAMAKAVFERRNIPRYTDLTARAFPYFTFLSPDSRGALVSLVFNRGAEMLDAPGDTHHRRQEMREVRDAMAARDFAAVPAAIRRMERLWTNGLVGRREAEATLFEEGLAA